MYNFAAVIYMTAMGTFVRKLEPEHRRMAGGESQEWRVLSRRRLFDGRPWVDVWAEDVELPDGRVIEGFYKLAMPDYVVVVPFVERGVLVQRQYKHGAGRVGLHLPAGYIEAGEEPLAAAQRELREETGYEADNWRFLGQFANDGNRGSGIGHFFAANGARPVRLPDNGDLEDSETFVTSFDELVDAARRGEVALLSTMAAIGLAAIDATPD